MEYEKNAIRTSLIALFSLYHNPLLIVEFSNNIKQHPVPYQEQQGDNSSNVPGCNNQERGKNKHNEKHGDEHNVNQCLLHLLGAHVDILSLLLLVLMLLELSQVVNET